MNCELAHEKIVMAEYGELPDDAAHELARHLTICPECAQEVESLRALKLLASAHPIAEPDPNLLARSRQRLEEAIDALPPLRWYERLAQHLSNNFARLQAAPVAAALMLVIGGAAGTLGGYYISQSRVAKASESAESQAGAQAVAQAAQTPSGEIGAISSIVHQPNSDEVQVSYNQIIPRKVSGTLNDGEIRQLLMQASVNAATSGTDDGSVALLAAECKARHGCRASGLSGALIVVLRYGRNADMRLKALEGLEPYVADDVQVRDAVLEALLNDSNPRVRTEAINMLEPIEADTSVRQVLHSVASSDSNPQIRLVSREALSRAPEIQ